LSVIDWDGIDLVVFDVDGTLYDQRALRLTMLRALLADAFRTRSLDTLLTLRTFRRVREKLGDTGDASFMEAQYARTASHHGKTTQQVRALVDDWMEKRPLAALGRYRYPHLEELFAGLRRHGKKVAVFSDYPAVDKLAAMRLEADPVVSATDPEIGRLKPDPAGLLEVLRRTGVAPQRTLMVGDRQDRDAAAAKRAGVMALIRGGPVHADFGTFRNYDDPVFAPILGPHGALAPGKP
jgi:phosphoglycolate phosphatase